MSLLIDADYTSSHLKMPDEGGGSRRDEASLGQDARLHVAKLQTGVVACHLTCGGGGKRDEGGWRRRTDLCHADEITLTMLTVKSKCM